MAHDANGLAAAVTVEGFPEGYSLRVMNPGETIVNPVTFRSEVSPSRDFETFVLALYQLGIEGRTGNSGLPRNPLQIAVLLELADFHFPGVPVALQRGFRRVLTALARRTGAAAGIHQYANKLR